MDYHSIINIPIEIINIITNLLDTTDKIFFISTNTYFLRNIYIDTIIAGKFDTSPNTIITQKFKDIKNISQDVIIQDKFKHIKNLYLHNNDNLDIMHLTKLNFLFIVDTCVSGLSFLQNLSKLHIYTIQKESYVLQNDIEHLSLTHLSMSFNYHITNIMHLTKLIHLDISGTYSKIQQSNINPVTNLTYLNLGNNTNITDISHFPNLTELRTNYINNIDISKSYNLRTLNIFNNWDNLHKLDVLLLTNLTQLNANIEIIEYNKDILKKMTNIININSIIDKV